MITCEHEKLRIDVIHESKHIGAAVGCYPDRNGDNQKWSFEMTNKSEHGEENTTNHGNAGNINPQSGPTYPDEAMVDLNSWFFIRNPVSGLVLDSTTKSQVKLARHNPQSLYQMWKRGPNQSIYCKGHGSNLVLDFDVDDFKRNGWGKIFLNQPHHDQNQQWILGMCIFSSFKIEDFFYK